MNKFVSSIVVSSMLLGTIVFAKTYATVDGSDITEGDVAVFLKNPQVKLESLPKENQSKILDRIIDNRLITKYAIKNGVESDKEYKLALEKVKENLALEVYMQKEFSKIDVAEAEMKDFYNKNKDKFNQPPMVKARHVLLKTKSEADSVISSLSSASDVETKFIEIAKEKSIGPSKQNGGDLGWFADGQMVPEFSKAAFALGKGKFSKTPVKTQYGYHVIYVSDTKTSGTAEYEMVKNNIKLAVQSEKFNKKMAALAEDLRKNAKITVK